MAMNKLIIDNRTKLTDLDALTLIKAVVSQGRISKDGKQYCYITAMVFEGSKYIVHAILNKKSDRFVIVGE